MWVTYMAEQVPSNEQVQAPFVQEWRTFKLSDAFLGAMRDARKGDDQSIRDALWAAFVAGMRADSVHEPEVAGVKCVHCNGSGEETQVYDEQNGWSEEKPCDTCKGTGRITTVDQYLKTLPANWHENSSLETWFPCTAAELERFRASQPPAVVQDMEMIAWCQKVHEDLAVYVDDGGGQMIHVRAKRALGIMFEEMQKLEKALYPSLTKEGG